MILLDDDDFNECITKDFAENPVVNITTQREKTEDRTHGVTHTLS